MKDYSLTSNFLTLKLNTQDEKEVRQSKTVKKWLIFKYLQSDSQVFLLVFRSWIWRSIQSLFLHVIVPREERLRQFYLISLSFFVCRKRQIRDSSPMKLKKKKKHKNVSVTFYYKGYLINISLFSTICANKLKWIKIQKWITK